MTIITLLLAAFIVFLWMTCVVVSQRETVVKERLGKFAGVLGPGLHLFVPVIDRAAYRHEMREQVIDVPPQACITRDNIQVEVDGIVYLKVMDAEKASYGIEDYRLAAINLAQTTMRSEIGKLSLDHTFSERETINENIVREVDKASDSWGIKVLRYEIKNISPSQRVVHTLEQQMEAERQKRAEITLASADKESRVNLSEGERQENINLSEGKRQQLINEAEGKAQEIQLLAEASARGIRRIAEAIGRPGGREAVRMQIVQQYVRELGRVLERADVSVVPGGLAQVQGVFEGLGQVATALRPDGDGAVASVQAGVAAKRGGQNAGAQRGRARS